MRQTTRILAAMMLVVAISGTARAESVNSLLLKNSDLVADMLSDFSREYLLNLGAVNADASILDIGDSLRGIMQIDSINSFSTLPGSTNDGLQAIFQAQVLTKVADPASPGSFFFTFGPDPLFAEAIAIDALSGTSLTGHALAIFWTDPAAMNTYHHDLTASDPGSPVLIDDGDAAGAGPSSPGLPDDTGVGPFLSEEALIATAKDGMVWGAFGFTGPVIDPDGAAGPIRPHASPAAGTGQGWALTDSAPHDLDILELVGFPTSDGQAAVGLDLLSTGGGADDLTFLKLASFVPGVVGAPVDMRGEIDVLGIGGIATPFDAADSATLAVHVIPTPAAAGIGFVLMAGLGLARPRRNRA